MDFHIETDQEITELSSGLGYWLWNLAVVLAPYDTGNLRRSIVMSANSSNHKKYVYNTMNAFYLDYLERGVGNIKKYKGFIEERTVGRMVEEVIQTSSNGAMFHEKTILKKLGVDLDDVEITGDDRKYLSRMKYGTKNRLKYERDNVKGSERAKNER